MRFGWIVLVLAACSSSASPSVDLTLSLDDTVTDDAVAKIARLVFVSSGDETGTFAVPLERAATRIESVVYRPMPTTRSLLIEVDALDANDAVVASGTTDALELRKTGSVRVAVPLSAPAARPDLGVSDASVPDAGPPDDAAMRAPDMAAFASPYFVNGSFNSSPMGADVSSITVNVPSNTKPGTLLLAMIAGINTIDSSPVLFNAPAGWSPFTSASSSSSPTATATWLWRYTTTTEPNGYTFKRSGVQGPTLGYIAAYAGTFAHDPSGPFDSARTASNPISGTAAMEPCVTQHDYTLLVLLGVAPDDLFKESWGTPFAMLQLQGTPIQHSYVACTGPCDNVSRYASLNHADSRSLELLVGLRSASP